MENFFYLLLVSSYAAPLLLLSINFSKIEQRVFVGVLGAYFTFFFLYNLFFDFLETQLGGQIYYLVYTLVEFSIFSLIVSKSDKSKKFKIATYSFWIFFLLYCAYRYVVKIEERMDSFEVALETCILIFMIIYFFYQRFKQVDEHYLYQNPYFWLMTGILTYLAYTYFFNILVNHVDIEMGKTYYHLSYIGDIVKNILFAVAIFYIPRRSESESRAQSFNAPKLDLV